MPRAAGRYSGTTIKEAMREVLIDAEMPLKLEVLAAEVSKVRKPRMQAVKPTSSGSIARAVINHADLFFRFGMFVALREWDEPADYVKFIDHYRRRRRA